MACNSRFSAKGRTTASAQAVKYNIGVALVPQLDVFALACNRPEERQRQPHPRHSIIIKQGSCASCTKHTPA